MKLLITLFVSLLFLIPYIVTAQSADQHLDEFEVFRQKLETAKTAEPKRDDKPAIIAQQPAENETLPIESDICMPYYGVYYQPNHWVGGCHMVAEQEPKVAHLKAPALAGDLEAQFQLGMHYCYLGWAGDWAAVRWFRMAAEQGDTEAQFHLGQILYTGLGVKPDMEAAYFWYSVALKEVQNDNSGGNVSDLEKYRRFAASRLPTDKVLSVDKLVEEWKPTSKVHIPERKLCCGNKRFEACSNQ